MDAARREKKEHGTLSAAVLLAAIGANMIKESFSGEESETSASFAFKTMLLMALASTMMTGLLSSERAE